MSLKAKALTAGRWSGTSALVRAVVQVVQTMVLARLLVPADFGLMAVAGATVALAALVADLGIGKALIHYDDVPDDALSTLYWLNLLASAVLALVFAGFAHPLSRLFDAPALAPVLQLVALVLPLAALGQQFRVLAEKRFRYRELATIEIAAVAAGFATACLMALAGMGVHALVGGVLATAGVGSGLAWLRLSDDWSPRLRFSLGDARPYLPFGSYLVGDTLVNTVHRNVDIYLGAFVLGAGSMGIYAVPRDLSLRVSGTVNPVITRVGFPVMARARADRATLRSVYLQTLRMTAAINCPAYVFLALFAEEVVGLLYGDRFRGAATYLRILAAWGLLRSFGNPIGSLLYAVGQPGRAMGWNSGVLVVMAAACWTGATLGGLEGLAWSLVAVQAALTYPSWRFLVRPACGIPLGACARAAGIPLVLAAGAAAVAAAAAAWIDAPALRLATGFLVMGAAYLGLSIAFNRPWVDAVLDVLRARELPLVGRLFKPRGADV